MKGERDLQRRSEPSTRDVSEWSWLETALGRERPQGRDQPETKPQHGERQPPRWLLCPAARGPLAPVLGTSRGAKTMVGPLAQLRPTRREREEEEAAASLRAERSILLTSRLLNGARGTKPALGPGQSGLCKARGRHQRPRDSPPGEWPLPPCLHNP